MPQRIKVSTGYADKVSKDFQSQQFSVGLEMELTVNGTTREIEDASEKLFALCRKIVSSQKSISVDSLLNGNTSQTIPGQNTEQPRGNGNGNGKPATAKQIRYLHQLGKKADPPLTDEQVRALPQQYYGKTLETMTSQEASNLIDVLGKKKAA